MLHEPACPCVAQIVERARRPPPRERRADEARPGGEPAQDSLERAWDLTELALDLFSSFIRR